jgi:hypothetical protein
MCSFILCVPTSPPRPSHVHCLIITAVSIFIFFINTRKLIFILLFLTVELLKRHVLEICKINWKNWSIRKSSSSKYHLNRKKCEGYEFLFFLENCQQLFKGLIGLYHPAMLASFAIPPYKKNSCRFPLAISRFSALPP